MRSGVWCSLHDGVDGVALGHIFCRVLGNVVMIGEALPLFFFNLVWASRHSWFHLWCKALGVLRAVSEEIHSLEMLCYDEDEQPRSSFGECDEGRSKPACTHGLFPIYKLCTLYVAIFIPTVPHAIASPTWPPFRRRRNNSPNGTSSSSSAPGATGISSSSPSASASTP
jgi:hypothetical protein